MTSACKTCGASIIWVRTSTGKNMPLDAEPVGGTFLLDSQPGMQPRARAVAVRLSHFATCPQADQHRRKAD